MWLEPGNFLEGKKAARVCRSSSGEMLAACVALQCYFLNFYEKLFETTQFFLLNLDIKKGLRL
jgi:hypothetical protein